MTSFVGRDAPTRGRLAGRVGNLSRDCRLRSGLTLLPLLAWLLVLAALPSSSSGTVLPRGFEEHTIARDLVQPTDVEWAPDGRMFVAEKAGRVLVYNPDGTRAGAPIVDISDHVVDHRERGLTGIAADRDFPSNGYLYLLYTYEAVPDSPTGPQVGRLTRVVVRPNNTAGPETVVLGKTSTAPCPLPSNSSDCIASDTFYHGGGTVRSDPKDGTLWVGFGDGNDAFRPGENAFRTYDEQSFAGKLLHVDRAGRGLPGHPFCPSDENLDHVCTKVYAKGFRNPFRFTLREGGGPIVGDVGSRAREEIDLAAPGRNYGWPCYEGAAHTPEYAAFPRCAAEYGKEGSSDAAAAPIYDYAHEGGNASITGGPLYTRGRYPRSYRGSVFFGDFVLGTIDRLRLDGHDRFAGTRRFGRSLGAPVDIELAPNGRLTYVDIGYGAVRQIRFRRRGNRRALARARLRFAGCVGHDVRGCKDLRSPEALGGVDGGGISGDGRDVYVASIKSGTLSHFRRRRSGGLRFASCVGSAVDGCARARAPGALRGTHTAAVSPDGRSVYTASSDSRTVERFKRDLTTGKVRFATCVGQGAAGCTSLTPTNALAGAHTVLVSGDGHSVYVTSTGSDAVAHFERVAANGALRFAGCIAQSARGCTALSPTNAIDGPHSAALSPDGASLYVPGYTSNTLAHFRRDRRTGALRFAGCIGQGASGCRSLSPRNPLDGPHGVAASADGRSVYTAAGRSGTLTHFARNPASGALRFVRCIGRSVSGCAPHRANGLEGAHWVAVSPDGRTVYVAARESSAVSTFRRSRRTGALSYQGCVAQGAAGCGSLSPLNPLGGEADWVEVSPDGRSLYTASFSGNTVAHFRRRWR